MVVFSKLKTVIKKYNRVLIIPEAEEDCPGLITGKGDMYRYFLSLRKKIEYIHNRIDSSDLCRNNYFEKPSYKNSTDLYKIPVSGNSMNIRVIACLKQVNEKKHCILLHIFKEKEARKDYERAFRIARDRYNKL